MVTKRRSQAGFAVQKHWSTRRRIAEAAAHLFSTDGYASTSLEQIARLAEVHVQTIYQSFGTKVAVLQAAFETATAGDEDPEQPFTEWAWVQEMLGESDSETQLRLFARHRCDLAPRAGPLVAQARDAARHDKRVRALLDEAFANEREAMAQIVDLVAARGDLRAGAKRDDLADGLFALTSYDSYTRLVSDRGWTAPRYTRWLGDRLCEYLLGVG